MKESQKRNQIRAFNNHKRKLIEKMERKEQLSKWRRNTGAVVTGNGESLHHKFCKFCVAMAFGMGSKDSDASAATPHHVAMRVEVNKEELSGSYIEDDLIKKNADAWLEHTTHAELTKGDELILQYIASVTTITIEQDDTYATQPFNAFGYIQEVIS